MHSKIGLFIILAFLSLTVLTACNAFSSVEFPDYVQQASHRVQEGYLFAVEHPDMLTHQPCYCGCGAMGHVNSLDCFVQEFKDDGTIIYDYHASGCGICVDIALDVKRLSEAGKSQLEIRRYIDATYSSFGPPTDTPLPEA